MKHLLTLATFAVLFPAVIGLRNFRLYQPDRKALTVYLLFSSVAGILTFLMWMQHANNLPLLHVYTIVEFVFISWIYSMKLRALVSPQVVMGITVLFVLFSVLNSIYLQSVYEFNTYAKGLEFILIILYALAYIYLLSLSNDPLPLKNQPMFWFNAGVLLYFTSSFFLFLLSNNIAKSMSTTANQITWGFHAVFLILYYVFLSVALWIRPAR